MKSNYQSNQSSYSRSHSRSFAYQRSAHSFQHGDRRYRADSTSFTHPHPLPNFSGPSYFLSGHSGLLHIKLIDLLQNHTFSPITDPVAVPSIDFVFLEGDALNGGRYDKQHQVIPSYLKNILAAEKHVITNKGDLHQGLLVHYLEHQRPLAARAIPPSFMYPCLDPHPSHQPLQKDDHAFYHAFVAQNPAAPPDHVVIVRPVGPFACAGKSITIATNVAQLRAAAAAIKHANPRWGVLASRYIQNPLLLPHGHKFHLRMYLLVRAATADAVRTMPFLAEVFRRGKIFQAAAPYPTSPTQDPHWDDKTIHDTHVGSTPHNLWFPEDFPRPEMVPNVFQQICETLSCVSRLMVKHAASYPESVHAFEVFGCDFMVDTEGKVWLIEINERVGYKNCGDRLSQDMPYNYERFSEDIFRWIYRTAVQPVFQTPPLEPDPEPFELLPPVGVPCSVPHPAFQFCAACPCSCIITAPAPSSPRSYSSDKPLASSSLPTPIPSSDFHKRNQRSFDRHDTTDHHKRFRR